MANRYLIVAGGRDFHDFELATLEIDKLLQEILDEGDTITIVEGGAKGADRLGRRYATELGIPFITMNADWNEHGRAAGSIRNGKMADIATDLIAFWDGSSRGTENMIQQASQRRLNVTVVPYEQ